MTCLLSLPPQWRTMSKYSAWLSLHWLRRWRFEASTLSIEVARSPNNYNDNYPEWAPVIGCVIGQVKVTVLNHFRRFHIGKRERNPLRGWKRTHGRGRKGSGPQLRGIPGIAGFREREAAVAVFLRQHFSLFLFWKDSFPRTENKAD